MQDIRDIIFKTIKDQKYRAVLIPETDGILYGMAYTERIAAELGVEILRLCNDGDLIRAGEPFAQIVAYPKQIAMAEERIIGTISKPSGIATAAAKAISIADGKTKIVSGAWKKMPQEIKSLIRNAVVAGGASFRITEPPMVYIDKNFVRMLGSVSDALSAATEIIDSTKVVQIRGETASIAQEALLAAEYGADIIMVDTGKPLDLLACVSSLQLSGLRDKIQVAFAGDVKLTDIPELAKMGADILDIGKAIIDAPLLDIRLDVVGGY